MWLTGLGLVVAMGCETEPEAAGSGPSTVQDGGSSPYDGAVWVPNDAGGGSWSTDGGALPGRDGGPAASSLTLPPEVCKVLQDSNCITCHKSPVEGGAPMPLQTIDHFKALTLDGMPLAQRVLARIKDTAKPMPPPSSMKPMMPAAGQAILQSWIDSGMNGVAGEPCQPAAVDPNSIGSDATPSWATAPWPEGECEYVMTIGAHNNSGTPLKNDSSAFAVPNASTSYECFYEKVPWGTKKVQALAMRARMENPDDKALVHHLVISGVEPGTKSVAGAEWQGPGVHSHCDNPSGNTMAIWAPGSINPLSYPADVGVLLPSGESLIEMQVHYDNVKNESFKQSRVQYDICATSKLRPQTAGVFWLGFENANAQTISGFENLINLNNVGPNKAQGKCRAKTKGRILSIMPHMHQQGKHGRVEILRKNGQTQTVLDAPFDFREQTSYFRESLWVEQGETVRSTCEFAKTPVHFGFASQWEMCFFYTLAYPIDVFKADPLAFEKGIVGGDLACSGAGGP